MARNLVLVGFMGSGKTVVGRRAAQQLGVPFVDLDDVIVESAGVSIVDIFRRGGEAEFRRLESEALRRVLAGRGQLVALGGGAVMNDDNWHLACDDNLVVRLKASPRAILRRIRAREERRDESGRRPRNIRPLADVDPDSRRWPEAQRSRVLQLMAEREARYHQASIQLDTTGEDISEVVDEVEGLARAAGINR